MDLDHEARPRVSCFDLLLRLMDEPAWQRLLYAEISAVTFFNHLDEPLRVLLARTELHDRLIHGSDYPLCALNVAIQTSKLVRAGFLEPEERRALDEIYRYNPLLFDFVVKRVVRHPESGARFSDAVFQLPPAWAEDVGDAAQ
jgi:uncharacterized protein